MDHVADYWSRGQALAHWQARVLPLLRSLGLAEDDRQIQMGREQFLAVLERDGFVPPGRARAWRRSLR